MPSSTGYWQGEEKPLSAALVYQMGIANVFVRLGEGSDASPWTRVLQGAYETCEAFALGMRCAGAFVSVFHCEKTGDIAKQDWEIGKGHLWMEKRSGLKI